MCKWYEFNFGVSWDRKQEPKTWVDIFIIDTIIREVIYQKKSEIVLWSVHRRWFNDQHGHELTFNCFINDKTANEIEKSIKSNNTFKILQNNSLFVNDLKAVLKGADNRSLTNGENWPDELKEAWPQYINGCCRMILLLIEKIKSGRNIPTDIQSAEQFYSRINNELIGMWQRFGGVAFFHHLTAIFGYSPLLIRPQFWASF
jgi:hypothetical protein